MPAFVERNDIQIRFTEYQRALCTDEYLVQSIIKAVLGHCNQIAACCQQRCFVDEISDVGTHHTWGSTSNRNQVYICRQRNAVCVNLENGQAPIPVRSLYCHTAVEATWAQERFVQPIGPVGRCDDHNCLVCIKAIHFHQQLVQGLLSLVVTIDAASTLPTHGINFVDEDDARSRLLGLVEEITHTACADTDQHLDKLRTAHR